tara:strand:- start:17 stop:565 length:549 start_codon:yes stop_codon:yes gene_type:complete
MISFDEEYSILRGIVLFTVVSSGTFISDLLDCNIKNRIKNSILLKHLLALLSIYLSLHISPKKIRPGKLLVYTIIIWLFFFLFTKMEPIFGFFAFLIIIVYFILSNSVRSIKNKKEAIKKYNKLFNFLIILFVTTMLTGVCFSIYRHSLDDDEFDIIKFLFNLNSANRCNSGMNIHTNTIST